MTYFIKSPTTGALLPLDTEDDTIIARAAIIDSGLSRADVLDASGEVTGEVLLSSGGFGRKIVNLTPHTINITEGDEKGAYPSDGIARVEALPLGDVVGLPPESKRSRVNDTTYVVSVLVAERLPERLDLVVPGEQVLNKVGAIVGCKSLARPRDCSPALAMLSNGGWLWVRQVAAEGATAISMPSYVQPGYPPGYAIAVNSNGTGVGLAFVQTDECPLIAGLLHRGDVADAARARGLTIVDNEEQFVGYIGKDKPGGATWSTSPL